MATLGAAVAVRGRRTDVPEPPPRRRDAGEAQRRGVERGGVVNVRRDDGRRQHPQPASGEAVLTTPGQDVQRHGLHLRHR